MATGQWRVKQSVSVAGSNTNTQPHAYDAEKISMTPRVLNNAAPCADLSGSSKHPEDQYSACNVALSLASPLILLCAHWDHLVIVSDLLNGRWPCRAPAPHLSLMHQKSMKSPLLDSEIPLSNIKYLSLLKFNGRSPMRSLKTTSDDVFEYKIVMHLPAQVVAPSIAASVLIE